mmetsp:Transcript_64456/g.106715  ORF Transcript_64456/g.106715 Transcript_64456/m.106715 type:complete len:212 (+) Transcript_64456:4031-4666(+)
MDQHAGSPAYCRISALLHNPYTGHRGRHGRQVHDLIGRHSNVRCYPDNRSRNQIQGSDHHCRRRERRRLGGDQRHGQQPCIAVLHPIARICAAANTSTADWQVMCAKCCFRHVPCVDRFHWNPQPHRYPHQILVHAQNHLHLIDSGDGARVPLQCQPRALYWSLVQGLRRVPAGASVRSDRGVCVLVLQLPRIWPFVQSWGKGDHVEDPGR